MAAILDLDNNNKKMQFNKFVLDSFTFKMSD